MAKIKLHTGPGVFGVLANVCRNPQEALKQFVENSADAIDQSKSEEGYILLQIQSYTADNDQSQGQIQRITVKDNGIGITSEKMEQVLNNIGDSDKIHLALRGEQGIGLLAFALIAEELHLASTATEGTLSHCLVLKRSWLKRGYAEVIEQCSAHKHTHRGTVAYLEGILPEIAWQLSKQRIKDYLGQQFASDLRANLYTMSISDNNGALEQIHSHRFRGVKVLSTSIQIDRPSSAFVELYVLPWEMPDAIISLYGRGGTQICALTDIGDFKILPWLDQRLEGYIRYDRLKRTADKTAIVQDPIFSSFVTKLRQFEPKIRLLIQEVSSESQERRFSIIVNRAGKLIDKFLRYQEKGLLTSLNMPTPSDGDNISKGIAKNSIHPVASTKNEKSERAVMRTPSRAPYIKIESPPDDKVYYRSWYDPNHGIIFINREHSEFLLSQREDRRCLRYLFYIWVKERLLQDYGTQADKVADEMVGVLAEAEPLLW